MGIFDNPVAIILGTVAICTPVAALVQRAFSGRVRWLEAFGLSLGLALGIWAARHFGLTGIAHYALIGISAAVFGGLGDWLSSRKPAPDA